MPKQYKHILVPLDGSTLAELALDDAFGLAKSNRANITLLQVIPPIDHVILTEAEHPIYIDQQWETKRILAFEYLQNICKHKGCGQLIIHLAVEMGPAAETIIDYAHDHDIDVIVMATHGRSGLQRWVYGSVADKVLRGANVPVLLVRAHAEAMAA